MCVCVCHGVCVSLSLCRNLQFLPESEIKSSRSAAAGAAQDSFTARRKSPRRDARQCRAVRCRGPCTSRVRCRVPLGRAVPCQAKRTQMPAQWNGAVWHARQMPAALAPIPTARCTRDASSNQAEAPRTPHRPPVARPPSRRSARPSARLSPAASAARRVSRAAAPQSAQARPSDAPSRERLSPIPHNHRAGRDRDRSEPLALPCTSVQLTCN